MKKTLIYLYFLLLIGATLNAQPSNIIINEIMASNLSTLADEDGDFSDWIELYNPGFQVVDLTNLYISDDPLSPTKWQFPSVSIQAGEYLTIFASSKDRLGSELHTNFSLNSSGEYLGVYASDGSTVIDEIVPGFPIQMADVSFGVSGVIEMYFSTPTPGAANTVGSFSCALSETNVYENTPNDTYIGTFIPLHHDASASFTYTLSNSAGGRFKIVGNQLMVANAGLLDYESDTNHSIDVDVSYGDTHSSKSFSIQVLDISEDIILNEIMASNSSTLQDKDGDYSDWIELYNPSGSSVNLSGRFISDDPNQIKKWGFPSNTIIPAGGYLVIFASGKNLTGSELHTNFSLNNNGEYLAIYLSDGTTLVDHYSPEFPEQLANISYGKYSNTDMYFTLPTPGSSNSIASFDFFISDSTLKENKANDATIGNLIPVNREPNDSYIYSLIDDAGGRFKISGDTVYVNNGSLLDYESNPTHIITVGVTYNSGQFYEKDMTLYLVDVSEGLPTDIIISEFMASNSSVLQDEDGDYSDWIELHNTGNQSINLADWFLKDGGATWQFPSVTIAADDYLVIFASDSNRIGSELHTNFKLSAGGDYIGLFLPDGFTVVHEYPANYPPQSTDISYGIYNGQEMYFSTPTPGTANTDGSLPIEPLVFSRERGFSSGSFGLSITTSTPNAEIRYTTDGSVPNGSNGTVYSGLIPINTTTVVRAIATANGYSPSPVETHSYIFLDHVMQQQDPISGYYPPKSYDVAGDWPYNDFAEHDHDMDLDVIEDPVYEDDVLKGLTDIPTLSISIDPDDIYDSGGFYDAEIWQDIEVGGVSVELIDADNPSSNSQADCGIQAHSHKRSKRSLRLNFKSEYGPAHWNTDLFKNAPLNGSSAKKDVNSVILRGGNNRSWARGWNPDKTTYTEDQWFRDSQIAMSGYGIHGTFVHLYINGIYWGLYNPVERPDEDYSANYLGGIDDDWYVANHDGGISGSASRYNYLTGTIAGNDLSISANYNEYQDYLEITSFIDYIILGNYGAVTDWPDNNYWLGNRNNPGGPVRFFVWDAEWSWNVSQDFGSVNGAWVHPGFFDPEHAPNYANEDIVKIFLAGLENSDFKMLFTDRVYKHCFNGGVLTDSSSLARWNTLNNYIYDAMILESAKWGDCLYEFDGELRTRNVEWQNEVNAIADIMDGNTTQFITALKADSLYPSIDPPQLSKRSGEVASGYDLVLTNPNGDTTVIYYTTDGTDPRESGGAISSSALIYSSAIDLADPVTIKARSLDVDDSEWSALDEAVYTISNDNSLPVELSSFQVSINSGAILLTWTTQSEVNNFGFEIYRSETDQNNYKLLANYKTDSTLLGNGNSNFSHDYLFIDKNIIPGKVYWYKLADVDFNGEKVQHKAVSIEYSIPEKFKLYTNYPNPFNPETTLKFDIPNRDKNIRVIIAIHNILGQKVKTLVNRYYQPGSYTMSWDGKNDNENPLGSGIYFALFKSKYYIKSTKMILIR